MICKVALRTECFTEREQSRHASQEPVQPSLHGQMSWRSAGTLGTGEE